MRPAAAFEGMMLMSGLLFGFVSTAAADQAAKEWRDPFTFGSRSDSVSTGGQVLTGVLWDASKPLAIIGQNMVGVGDFIGSRQVVEIRQDGIVVESAQQRIFVSVGSMVPSN